MWSVVFCFREEADLLARALGCRLLRTSVKEDVNVAAVFRHLAARCVAELREPRDDYYPPPHGLPPITISKYQLRRNEAVFSGLCMIKSHAMIRG